MLVIGNILDESKITFGMNHNKYKNVKFIYTGVKYIDYERKYIETSNDLRISFDYLIMSPGIGFKEKIIEGYSPTKQKFLPHCWDGESKIIRFKSKLNELEKNPTIIISAPDYPYRCPPAPYERASLLANYFKRKGYCLLLEERYLQNQLFEILIDLKNNQNVLFLMKKKMREHSDKETCSKIQKLIESI